jgi:hypothetical protein
MRQLRREAFGRARRFLVEKARPLERVLFECRFEDAGAKSVLAELARFQNEDGGFGKALEPDLRSPSSSALATGIGLRILKELECPPDHPMVRKAVAYLVETHDDATRVWRVAPQDANDHPHAPWWHDEDGSLASRFDGFRIIPRALLVSFLHAYSTLVPAGWVDKLTEETVSCIETVEILGEGGGSDLEYAIHLAETDHLPRHYAARLKKRIRKVIPAVVVRDPARWNSYCITPLTIVPTPQSFGADLIHDELQMHLDYQVAQQTPEGVWEPVWSWGESFPEAWVQARLEWCGHLTLETLTQLEAFGRIEA